MGWNTGETGERKFKFLIIFIYIKYTLYISNIYLIVNVYRDAASLEKFIAEKLGHEVPEEKPAAPESAEVPIIFLSCL